MSWALAALLACLSSSPLAAEPVMPSPAKEHLRVVGGLAGVNQFIRHEEPFWAQHLPRLTGGRATAEIVPFDKAGLSGSDLLRAIQIGTVPFGTVLLNLAASSEPEVNVADLAGLNPDFDSYRRSVQSYRPRLAQLLRDRYGLHMLAVYTYPAQVMYCAKPFGNLAELAGRRIRVAAETQADFVSALGAQAVRTPFSQIVSSVRSGSVDCAITGTMSGNTIGLHEVTSHIHPMALSWGLAAFVVQAERWNRLDPIVRATLERELPALERAIWAEAQAETEEGLACNTGERRCKSGKKGRMTLVHETPADHQLRLQILQTKVWPGWLQRCNGQCADLWQSVVATRPELRVP
jgi:TRAP-type C4-dicarboxylate transport system substrate-binding protein